MERPTAHAEFRSSRAFSNDPLGREVLAGDLVERVEERKERLTWACDGVDWGRSSPPSDTTG